MTERDGLAARLVAAVPHPRCELDFASDWELLVATILSAQSTDQVINRITPELFARWPTPRALADAAPEDVQRVVFSSGSYRKKADMIQRTAHSVAGQFGGVLPRTVEELVTLPGVGRKTANVVLGTAHGLATGFVVDTHVARVAQRLQLTAETKPERIEAALCQIFPREQWIEASHRLLLHGRYQCVAKKPRCAQCALNELCPSREASAEGTWAERASLEARTIAARVDAEAPAA